MTEQEREEMERLQLEELRFNQKVRDAQKKRAKYVYKPLIIVMIVLIALAIIPLILIAGITVLRGLSIHFQNMIG